MGIKIFFLYKFAVHWCATASVVLCNDLLGSSLSSTTTVKRLQTENCELTHELQAPCPLEFRIWCSVGKLKWWPTSSDGPHRENRPNPNLYSDFGDESINIRLIIKVKTLTVYTQYNKNLYGRDGRTICGPQCVSKSTSVTLAVDEKTLPMATITGRTDRRTDRRTESATQYAAPS